MICQSVARFATEVSASHPCGVVGRIQPRPVIAEVPVRHASTAIPAAEAIWDRVRRELWVIERLQTANIRVTDAQRERIWAIKSAHELGLSIRQIAT